MNELKVFENEEFGSIRTIEIDGEPWFVGKDVAQALGYGNTRDAVYSHVDEEDRRLILKSENATLEIPNRGLVIINESGLYSLILSSKLPSAKRFKHWVTSEVIPSIRKHGTYVAQNTANEFFADQHTVVEITRALIEEREKNASLRQQLTLMRPKAEYFDAFIKPGDCTNLRVTSQELGVPEKDFVLFLIDSGYLYRDNSHKLMPYSEYTKRGYFIVRDFYRPGGGLDYYTLFTCKGKNHFRKLLAGRR